MLAERFNILLALANEDKWEIQGLPGGDRGFGDGISGLSSLHCHPAAAERTLRFGPNHLVEELASSM